jgi:hypothetical protein
MKIWRFWMKKLKEKLVKSFGNRAGRYMIHPVPYGILGKREAPKRGLRKEGAERHFGEGDVRRCLAQ